MCFTGGGQASFSRATSRVGAECGRATKTGQAQRKVKHVPVAEDPTFGRLRVPQARPEQWKRDKVILREHYLLAREHLAPHWRDGMDVQAGTGWHARRWCASPGWAAWSLTGARPRGWRPESGCWRGAPSASRSMASPSREPARGRASRPSHLDGSGTPSPPGPLRRARTRPRWRPSSITRARAPRGASPLRDARRPSEHSHPALTSHALPIPMKDIIVHGLKSEQVRRAFMDALESLLGKSP